MVGSLEISEIAKTTQAPTSPYTTMKTTIRHLMEIFSLIRVCSRTADAGSATGDKQGFPYVNFCRSLN